MPTSQPTFTTKITVHCCVCHSSRELDVPLVRCTANDGEIILAVDREEVKQQLITLDWTRGPDGQGWAHHACAHPKVP